MVQPMSPLSILVTVAVAMALVAGTVPQPMCNVSHSHRIDCHLGEDACEASGCCWERVDPNPSNVPWCFRTGVAPSPANAKCAAVKTRADCGHGNEGDCVGNGCCWQPVNPNPDNQPWCFQKGDAPSPAPSPTPPAPAPQPHPSPPGNIEPSSSAFVHLFEWSWSDVAQECEDFLGPKGFTAVQISPPNEHIQGPNWWTRYQPVTYKLVSRSGDEAAFTDMVQRCAKVGVGIYADCVINHIAAGSGTGVAGGSYGNRATPIYDKEDMHHNDGDVDKNCGVTNYDDLHNVQYCDLVGLPDLCTGCEKVQKNIAAYISHMSDIGIAGFRVDAAKHQDPKELAALLQRVPANLFRFHEVISGAGEAVRPSMYYGIGHITEFQYFRQLDPNLENEDKMTYLKSFGESWGFMPTQDAIVFLDNHDTQRGEAAITFKNGKLYQFANIFMLAHPYGYPKVMSSYYFDSHDQGPPSTAVHSGSGVACGTMPSSTKMKTNMTSVAGAPWVCEHRWTPVANMVAWRKTAGKNWVSNFQTGSDDQISFCRGGACIALNRDGNNAWSTQLKTSLPAGEYCDIILSDNTQSCEVVTVGDDGSARVQVPPLGAVAFHTGKRKAGAHAAAVVV